MSTLLKNISTLLTLDGAVKKQGRFIKESDLGIQYQASVVLENGRIVWVGAHKKLPKAWARKKNIKEFDMKGMTVLPGLVECHSHLVFAGDRAAEFEQRNQGATYQEIAGRGGGILSTVKNTRSASRGSLVTIAQERAKNFVAQGVTTLEVKSGYALNLKDELKMLQVVQELKDVRTIATFLGAHALPPEFASYDEYLNFLGTEVLPIIKKKRLAQRVDIFIEKGFFSAAAGEAYLKKAKDLGLDVVVHADQLSLSGGSDVATRVGALSADHLIQVGPGEIRTLAQSSVTCVLLPAADLYMKMKYPPARQLIDAGARVALATDFNPGTSPTQDINLVGLLARLEMKMTLPEVIAAYTIGGAFALGLETEVGAIEIGRSADILSIEGDWQTLFYSVGERRNKLVFHRGKRIYHGL